MKLRNIILGAIVAVGCLFSMTGCSKSSVGNVDELTFADGDKIAEITIEGYGTIKAKLFPDLAPKAVDNFIQLAEQGYYDGLKIHRVAPESMMQGGSLNGDGTGGEAIIDPTGSFPIETSELARNFYGALCYANTNGQNTCQFYIVNSYVKYDITMLDPAKIRAKAAEYTAQKESLPSGDPSVASVTAMETYYNNLATMLEKADEKVIKKYAEFGGYPMWDGGYTVFGQTFEGFEIIDQIAKVETTADIYGNKTKPVQDIIIESVVITEYKTPGTGESAEEPKDEEPETAESLDGTAEVAGTGEVDLSTTEVGTPSEEAVAPVE